MNNKTKNVLLIVLSLAVILLTVRVIFDEEFDNFNRYVEERENYNEGEEAYDENLGALSAWMNKYKADNPGASDDEATRAFEAAWRE